MIIVQSEKKNFGSGVIKPVGEVLLPRISGIPSSSLCKHQQIRNQHNCRPRIPREQYPCGFSHRLLQCDVDGVSPFARHLSCRLYRQWHLVLNTLHRWEWNTIVCSNHGSHGDEDCHSRRLATLWYRMFSWKCIPLKWPKEERSGRWTEILFRFSWIRKVLWDRLEANISRMFRIYLIPLLKLLYLPC